MTRAGYTVASGFTLLYVVTACCADNDSTPIPCRPLSHSGAVTPVLATAFAPHAFLNLTMNQFDARQRYVEDLVGPPTFECVRKSNVSGLAREWALKSIKYLDLSL